MHELRGLPLWGQLGHQDMDITCWPCLCLVFIFWGRSHCIPWEKTAEPWPLVYHFSLSIASTISEQNLCRQSNSDLAFFAWVSWTWAFWSSGSLLVISFTSTTLLGSFCQRRSGPFNQFEATRCSAVRPAVDWWNFFRSHIPPLCWLCALLDPFYSVCFKHMKSSGFIFMYQSTTFESVEKNPCGQPTSSSFLRMSLLLSVSSRIKVVSLSVSIHENFTTWLTWLQHGNVGRYMSIFDILHDYWMFLHVMPIHLPLPWLVTVHCSISICWHPSFLVAVIVEARWIGSLFSHISQVFPFS